MKKNLSTTKIIDVLGPPLKGPEFPLFGLQNWNDAGLISEVVRKGSVKKMLDVIDLFYPEIHIVTYLRNRNIVNRHVKEDVLFYKIFRGNPDPSLEFIYDDESRRRTIQTFKFLSQVMRGEHPDYFGEDSADIVDPPHGK